MDVMAERSSMIAEYNSYTIDREIFVVKNFSSTTFSDEN